MTQYPHNDRDPEVVPPPSVPAQPTEVSSDAGLHRATGPDRSTGTGSTVGGSSTDTAKDKAKEVGQTAGDAGKNVAETVKGEASSVLDEVKEQARSVTQQAGEQLSQQASTQQERALDTIRSLRDEFGSMAEHSEDSGLATQLVRQASERLDSAASWIGDKEPRDLLDDVKSFARRKPALFIGIALGAGILAGRLTRGVVDDKKEHSTSDGSPKHADPLAAQTGTGPTGDYLAGNQAGYPAGSEPGYPSGAQPGNPAQPGYTGQPAAPVTGGQQGYPRGGSEAGYTSGSGVRGATPGEGINP
ncbi:hypothetical protein LWF01_00400 [Saxibacter everestensis]|uniref:DUF3618 domain-containing protein n=1 Tax=Saxibacter everestensis TaxID=2909229 RepID=A0ABY8QTC3_9MICO|nr:hypothetical protein LWF01_00400 [Brevibacteriaceae bacterium ZFBP1038]